MVIVFLFGFYEIQNATNVIGQPNFTAYYKNQALTQPESYTLSNPFGVWVTTAGKVAIADTGNNRVLIFNSIPQNPDASADIVIGQTNFNDKSLGTASNKLNSPHGVYFDENYLMVADKGNNRVLIFKAPYSTGMSASHVIGQPDFTTNIANYGGGPSSTTLNSPYGVYFDGTYLWVADTGNNRVLRYNFNASTGTQSWWAADFVIGQNDFTQNTAGVSENKLSGPYAAYSDTTKVMIADSGNSRVVITTSVNSNTFENVLGQPTMYEAGSGINMHEFDRPKSLLMYKNRLFVCDTHNHRILIFPTTQTYSFAEIRISPQNNHTQNTLSYPGQISINNDRLFVADGGNSRVMIFEDIFGISKVSPSSSTNKTPVDIELYGNDFPDGVLAALKMGTYTITGELFAYSTYYLKFRFDVTGKKSGFYNIELTSSTKKFVKENAFELKNFLIKEVIPNWQYRVAPVPLYIKGDGFIDGSIVKLTYPGEEPITGSSVKVSTNLITAVFDIRNKKVGLWSVVVSSGDETAILPDSFLVLHPYPANLLLEYIASAIYEGTPLTLNFSTKNIYGNITIPQDSLKTKNINIIVSIAANIPQLPKEHIKLSDAFDFSPNGIEFDNDVDVELNIGKITNPELVRVLVYKDSWEEIKPYYADSTGKIKFKTRHFSIYMPAQAKPADFSSVIIYPNPFSPLKSTLKIKNFPADTKVKIFSVSGEIVNELSDTGSGGIIEWNGKNFSGKTVSSGIYILYLTSPDSYTIKKVAVLK